MISVLNTETIQTTELTTLENEASQGENKTLLNNIFEKSKISFNNISTNTESSDVLLLRF
jgi:hypothetical protein